MKFTKKSDGVYELDVLGYTCPHPQLYTKKTLEKVGTGDIIELLFDNPSSSESIAAMLDNGDNEIIERVENGEVVACPIVNVLGFIGRERYLPDGRDLNRSFPGSARGSTAARLAHLFLTEIVGRCTHGIDLHTAGGHRVNLPQVRTDLGEPTTRAMARACATSAVSSSSRTRIGVPARKVSVAVSM